MDLLSHFRLLARYNRTANQRLYDTCAGLDDIELRSHSTGPFGSILGLLNHILLGDTIWMARFEGAGAVTPPLDTVLYERFADLRPARATMDERIEAFLDILAPELLERSFRYVNNQGKPYVEAAPVALAHLFNHQAHHRGQVCMMLAVSGVPAPNLDLHRITNPEPENSPTVGGSGA